MRCWGIRGAEYAICWPDCGAFFCAGECDSDGSCVTNAQTDCDPACGLICSDGGGSAGDPGGSGGATEDHGFDPDGALAHPMVDIRADTNRDGVVDLADPTDDEGEDAWTSSHGAIFLANIDDDQQACPKRGSDAALASCNDAEDTIVNGANDLLDMARLVTAPWLDVPSNAYGALTVNAPARPFVRFFIDEDGSFRHFPWESDTLSAAVLRSGATLALEGTDIVRDANTWDGILEVTFYAIDPASESTYADRVQLRLAPMITRHHLDPPSAIYLPARTGLSGESAFVADFEEAARDAGLSDTLVSFDLRSYEDPWMQDYFETAYMAMPAPAGSMHVIHVNIRSANVYDPWSAASPLRPAGRIVFTEMRGPDVAGVSQYDVHHAAEMDSLNSFGNTETIPPHTHRGQSYPLGRLLRGRTSRFYPDPSQTRMFESQLVQPPVYIDTSWLLVGHVDETISFVRADNARGWTVLVNDAALAKAMLEQEVARGNGSASMFVGKYSLDDWGREYSAQTTVSQVLGDPDVMGASAEAVVEVAAQLDILKAEVGLTDDDVLRAPFLHIDTYGSSVAYQPGTVNGASLGDSYFGSPRPHGPSSDGVDIFEKQLEEELAKIGVTVLWIEDWDLLHRGYGEVHCGSNMTREIPTDVKWWEAGL